jgi:hypothetical protein
VGLAKFVGLLAIKMGSDMKRHSGMLLKVLNRTAQEERSPAARRAFVSACASVAKYSSPVQVQALFEDTVAFYSTGSANAQITAGLLLRELSRQISDTFSGYHALVLPLAFMARFVYLGLLYLLLDVKIFKFMANCNPYRFSTSSLECRYFIMLILFLLLTFCPTQNDGFQF